MPLTGKMNVTFYELLTFPEWQRAIIKGMTDQKISNNVFLKVTKPRIKWNRSKIFPFLYGKFFQIKERYVSSFVYY